jgi:hypothetical protein
MMDRTNILRQILKLNFKGSKPEQDGSARYYKTWRRKEKTGQEIKKVRLWEDRRDCRLFVPQPA